MQTAPCIVQKFGGTSVGNPERIRHVARRVMEEIDKGNRVVVVVSAMGHSTDELIELAKTISSRPHGREMDALLATGEQVSAALLAMALIELGQPACSLTGWQVGIETNHIYGSARMLRIRTDRLQMLLDAGKVPVVCGFQGVVDGNITTLGRGGSDTTAVALAAALKAKRCDIYTDVTGVFTTDPRVVPQAQKLSQVSYDEMLELAGLGAQVLHPRAVETAKAFGVPLTVRSTFQHEEGTMVVETVEMVERQKSVTGIAFEREVARLALIGVPLQKHGLAVVFGKLADIGVNVDVIVQSVVQEDTVDVSFTVSESDALRSLDALKSLQSELQFSDIQMETGLGKVSIVGAGMITHPGVAAEMFSCLAESGIPVSMVSTSEMKISCMIRGQQVDTAVTALHRQFLEESPTVNTHVEFA